MSEFRSMLARVYRRDVLVFSQLHTQLQTHLHTQLHAQLLCRYGCMCTEENTKERDGFLRRQNDSFPT